MVLICKRDVPLYLQNSALFQLLDPNDEEEFDVPAECFKQDLYLTCLADLRHYLQTIQYWGVDSLDDSVLIYMYRNCNSDVVDTLHQEFYQLSSLFTLVKALHDSYPEDLVYTALVQSASVELISWLHEEVYWGFRSSDCAAASRRNNLPALMYLHEQGCPWNEQTVINAVALGHLDCLKYALSNDCPRPKGAECFNCAAHFSQLEVMKYLRSQGFEFKSETLAHAVHLAKNLDCVRYLLEIGCPLSADALFNAACTGNLACLQYLWERGCPWDNDTAYNAAYYGQLACVMYLHKQGCPFHRFTPLGAAAQGHPACLQFAHAVVGCPVDFLTYFAAVRGGSLECVVYVAQNSPYPDSLFIKLSWCLCVMTLCCIVSLVYQSYTLYLLLKK